MAIGTGVRFKADDIWETPDDGMIYEVIDGELYVSPAPLEVHQFASSTLHIIVGSHVRYHRLGRLYAAPTGLVLGDETGAQPDLIYVSNARRGVITRRGIEGAPDLVVEILSARTQAQDRGIKMRRYARAGIPHYWLFDPQARQLEAYKLGPDGYALVDTFGPGTTFRPELFPGLEIPIDELSEEPE